MDDHICSGEWLRDQLERPFPSVLVLDCRSHCEYQKGHLHTSINVTLPALMLKRLINGSLSVPAVIKCQQARDVFLAHWKTDCICLYDEASSEPPMDSTNSVMKTLGEKLRAEGCKVFFLAGKVTSSYCIFRSQPMHHTGDSHISLEFV